jgi:CRP-like cAMP-binding protein
MREAQAAALRENAAWLRRVPLFSQMDDAKLRMLAFASERLAVAEGDHLYRQGDKAEASYVIVEGKVAIIHEDEDGAHEILTLKEGDLVGELSLFTDEPCLTSARALAPLQLLRISKGIHLRMQQEFPDISVGMTRILAEALSHGFKEIFRLRRLLRKYDPQDGGPIEPHKPGEGKRL